MKLGLSMYSYVGPIKADKLDFPGFIAEAKNVGADGVELLDFFYTDTDRERAIAQQALADHNLVCSVFSVANNFAKLSADERSAQVDRIRFGVDEAILYGAKTVRVFAGDTPADGSIGFSEALGWIIEGLSEASNYAHDRGIKLALENHGKLAGRGDQVRTIIDGVRQKCGHAALGANPDTGNFVLVGQAGHEGVAEVADLAYMVHFKDFAATPDGWDGYTFSALDGSSYIGAVLGEGLVDLSSCVQSLKDAGFDGWLNLEYEGETSPFEGVPRSMENARKFIPR